MAWRLAHLPVMLLVSGALLALAALVGGLTRGTDGALGAAAGVLLAVFSFTVSTLIVAWAAHVNASLVLPFGLATYVVKMTLFGVVMVIVLDSGWPGMVPMGLGIAAGVVVWSATQIWWVLKEQRSAEQPPGGTE
jgi:hypothetical protein